MLRSNIMSIFKSHMRAQSRTLKLSASVIVVSAAVFAPALEPQRLSLKLHAGPAPHKSDSRTILTVINVSVIDGNDQHVPNLSHKDFTVFEDDVKQEIAYWVHDESSVNFGLALDISDYEPLKLMARQVAAALVGQTGSNDEVAIPQLKAENGTFPGFASDKQKFENSLSGISSKNQLAGLVTETIEAARKKSKYSRGAAVVITDGLSLSGAVRDRDEAYAILRQGAPVYFMILDDGRFSARAGMQSRVRQARNLLAQLARASGGLALVVKNEGDIPAATGKIIQRLKAHHIIGYSPMKEKFDGSFRNIRVIVTPKDKRKVKVFAPSGYYAEDPKKSREEKLNDRK